MNGKNLAHWEVKKKYFPKAGTIEKKLTLLLWYAIPNLSSGNFRYARNVIRNAKGELIK